KKLHEFQIFCHEDPKKAQLEPSGFLCDVDNRIFYRGMHWSGTKNPDLKMEGIKWKDPKHPGVFDDAELEEDDELDIDFTRTSDSDDWSSSSDGGGSDKGKKDKKKKPKDDSSSGSSSSNSEETSDKRTSSSGGGDSGTATDSKDDAIDGGDDESASDGAEAANGAESEELSTSDVSEARSGVE
ncbi:unnamed protein product, partial [Amoebophrya sp. A25]